MLLRNQKAHIHKVLQIPEKLLQTQGHPKLQKKFKAAVIHTTLSGTPGGGNERFLGGGPRR